MVQLASGRMVWEYFFVTILDSAYLSTVAVHVNPFMVTVNLFYDGCSQQDSLPGVSNHFETPGNDNEVSVLKRPPLDVVEWKILIMHVEKKIASTVWSYLVNM